MNGIKYVATEIKHTDSGNPYGSFAKVYVNGSWRFALYPRDRDGYCHVVMLTRQNKEGNWQAASFDMLGHSDIIDKNLTELAQLFAPF